MMLVALVSTHCGSPSRCGEILEGDADGGDVSLACWSLVHGLSALIVDDRLAEYDSDPAEAVAARLTRLLSDSLAALSEKKSELAQRLEERVELRVRPRGAGQ
jgi:hypothetical protein